MKPLSLPDKNKLAAAYGHALRAITALLTRAGVFLISLGVDGHAVSRGIASLTDALTELQGTVIRIEDWIECMANSQTAQANPVEDRETVKHDMTSPCTPPRSTHLSQSPCMGPTSASPSPAAPSRASTPWLAFPQSSPQVTSLFQRDIQNTPLAIRNAPALFNHMRAVPIYQTPRTLGVFGNTMTSRATTPLAYGVHHPSIDTPRSIPSFWRPAPKAHAIKLMIPDSARHRKKPGKENEGEVPNASAVTMSTPPPFV
ncbi:hypothetical protein DEU56DRAFT_911977 [Suillus clintonianus]|uniref:uncharacterized protein n=1 Tax=Suillus clintonianus TaxID=1904413 RepID=UPI001B8805F1|nr:uncharacterized protein DEU56DRAFT_911977 [Suillus clintonianus]KAG2139713.1 hypothetical protein DEU56DRAFT_911977 [Suillus clintonianus]